MRNYSFENDYVNRDVQRGMGPVMRALRLHASTPLDMLLYPSA